MKSLEVWRRGYKADFSPWRWRSKCKVSPLPCLPWDSVGGVGQGQFCILHKSGIEFPGAGRSPGLAVWPGMLGRLAAWVERLGGGLIGCRWWAALLCCDFLCAPSLFSPLPLSPSPDRRLPGCRRWCWLWCLAGRWLCMGAGVPGSLGWVGLALPCWPCVLSASAGCWLCLASSGAGSPLVPAGLCWALTAWGLLGAGSGSAWASLAPGSALVQGWRVSRPCRWWWLGWVMGRRWAWWLAYPVRQIAQIKPCRFGYYSREKR